MQVTLGSLFLVALPQVLTKHHPDKADVAMQRNKNRVLFTQPTATRKGIMPSFKEGSALEDLYETIMEHVHQGSFDDERLHKLAERVKDRQWELYRQVQIGDRIRVIGNMSPKYIVGATGTVVAKYKEKVEVDIEPEFIKGRRFEGKGPLGFPFTNFIKIGDKQPTTLTGEDISPATKNLQDRINKFLETQDG